MSSSAPYLPNADPKADDRRAAIELDRKIWRFDRSWHGLTFPDANSFLRATEVRWFGTVLGAPDIPDMVNVLLGVGWQWIFQSLGYAVRAGINNWTAHQLMRADRMPGGPLTAWRRSVDVLNDRVTDWIWKPNSPDGTPPLWRARPPLRLGQYEEAVALVRAPQGLRHWHHDEYFAWQRLGGTSPVALRWVSPGSWAALRERFPLTPERFSRARPGDDLARAEAEGRLFVVDYSILDDIEAGASFGWRKWLCAPIALFALTVDRRKLMPVAIQCGQKPDATTPIFTPSDGMAWQLAKTTFQVAESNYHGIVEHGIHCHMAVGAIAIALRRTMAPWHPVRLLIEPHIDRTIPIDLATRALFQPGGRTSLLQSVTVDGLVELARRGWREFNWDEQSGAEHFEGRGVLDRDVLPEYPMRDDILPYIGAIGRFVDGYLALYYRSDADVAADTELFDFVTEVRSRSGADLPSVQRGQSRIATLAGLARLLRDVIWRASPYHCVINYSIYDAMVYQPNMPTAAYAPPPVDGVTYGLDDLLSMFPPRQGCAGAVNDGMQVGNLRLNRLGYYPSGQFRDRRVVPVIAAFKEELREIGRKIEEANSLRAYRYAILDPAKVTASIHI